MEVPTMQYVPRQWGALRYRIARGAAHIASTQISDAYTLTVRRASATHPVTQAARPQRRMC